MRVPPVLKRDEQIEIINGKMDVVDKGKEDRIEKVKKLQWIQTR